MTGLYELSPPPLPPKSVTVKQGRGVILCYAKSVWFVVDLYKGLYSRCLVFVLILPSVVVVVVVDISEGFIEGP
jgi:hypothetical protein